MVIPVGPPGAQHVIKATKTTGPAGNVWTLDANLSKVFKYTPEGRKLLEIDVGGVPVDLSALTVETVSRRVPDGLRAGSSEIERRKSPA